MTFAVVTPRYVVITSRRSVLNDSDRESVFSVAVLSFTMQTLSKEWPTLFHIRGTLEQQKGT